MCIVTANMDTSIRLWRDVLGFKVGSDSILPDGPEAGPDVLCDAPLLDKAFEAKGARSRCALLYTDDGAKIELQQPLNPLVAATPPHMLRYRHTGFHELGLAVDDIDQMFSRVRAAGYQTQTDYVWSAGTLGRSFIFYDAEGNMIQLWQDP
jgi:catechol 2,3-dioxygenase-like lactoylglutathione lyase family enzyme